MRRCEDEKMFHRPPLLEEPCAQTLSGKSFLMAKVVRIRNLSHLSLRFGPCALHRMSAGLVPYIHGPTSRGCNETCVGHHSIMCKVQLSIECKFVHSCMYVNIDQVNQFFTYECKSVCCVCGCGCLWKHHVTV